MAEQYCTVQEVAKAYNVELNTVYSWCKDGLIPGVIRAGRKWRIPVKYKQGNISIEYPVKK